MDVFDLFVCRNVCDGLMGRSVGDHVWRSWKKSIGSPRGSIGFDDLMILAANAILRKSQPHGALDPDLVREVIGSPKIRKMVRDLVDLHPIGATGWAIVPLLQARGIKIDRAQLKARFSGFSPNKFYDLEEVIFALEPAVKPISTMPDLPDRHYSKTVVRRSCEGLIGASIARSTFLNWEKWIELETLDFSHEQFAQMLAIASLRSVIQRRELKASQIKTKAESQSIQGIIEGITAIIDSDGWALGWDVLKVLEFQGRSVTPTEVRSAIPSFSPSRWYKAADVWESVRG